MALIELFDKTSIDDCHRANHAEWGIPLSHDKYLERELILAQQPFSKGQRYWALIIDDLIVAHCESYDRIATFHINSQLSDGKCASIASVFVRTQYRNRGYGKQMMKQLLERLIHEGYGMSTLYSDIGPKFYEQLGWKNYSSLQLTFDSSEVEHTGHSCTLIESYEEVTVPTVKLTGDSVYIRTGQKEWQWFKARQDFYADYYKISDAPLGRRCGKSWILYFYDFRWNCMYIMSSHLACYDDAVQLVEAFKEDLVKFKDFIKYGSIWNPCDLLYKAVLPSQVITTAIYPQEKAITKFQKGVKLEYRLNDSLPSMWCKYENVQWLQNFRDAWV